MSFDFGPVLLIAPNILIPPKCEQLAQYRFIVPRSVWGRKHFTLGYQINYFNGNSRKLYGNFADKHGMYFIIVCPRRQINTSQYRIFVSRGIRGEDRTVGDFVVQRMRQWNLTTRTVGIEVHASQRNTSGIIKEEIKKADGVVAIATPRNYDQITKNWRTLEWLQSEVGIAFGVNKPLLIFMNMKSN
jgi:hypothetical protein